MLKPHNQVLVFGRAILAVIMGVEMWGRGFAVGSQSESKSALARVAPRSTALAGTAQPRTSSEGQSALRHKFRKAVARALLESDGHHHQSSAERFRHALPTSLRRPLRRAASDISGEQRLVRGESSSLQQSGEQEAAKHEAARHEAPPITAVVKMAAGDPVCTGRQSI